MNKLIISLAAAILSLPVAADEGMWLLPLLKGQRFPEMQALGLKLQDYDIYSPDSASLKDAVVIFGGGCTGEIVSPEGLLLTNHHCGYGCIQRHSTLEHDYLTDGFWAMSRDQELPNPGMTVTFIDKIEDVTDYVKKELEKDTDPNSMNFLSPKFLNGLAKAKVGEKFLQDNPGTEVEIKAFYGGNQYFMFTKKIYSDIRLVGAPPSSIGKFGADTDNWMWPRQTCDFSVFRIYADKDNQPAEYSADNRPLKAERYAKVSLEGFKKGDYCMTIGYPGRTNRYLSSYGIVERMENTNESRINVRGVKQGIWKKWMDSDPKIRLQYASKYANSSNYWKNSIGMNKALKELKVVEQKKKQEQQINEWAQKSKKRQERFGNLAPELEKAYAARKDGNRAIAFLNESFLGGPDLMRIAFYFDNLQNAGGETGKATWKNRLRQQYKDWNEEVDKETMTALIDNYAKQVKPEYLPDFYQTIEKEYNNDIRAYVDAMFKQSVLTDTNCVNLTLTQEQKDNDMALKCLKSVMELGGKVSDQISQYNMDVAEKERLLCEAILEMEMDQPHYSDANSTMRLSYGFVDDYTSAAGHQNYFTTMLSLLDKVAQSDRIDEYKVEPEVKALFEKGDFGPYKDKESGEMQLCFLTNNDITGGNSGSPMFNGKGELIGLAFDGNWDALSSDITFTQDLTRCIGVDIRYVLYIIDRWGKAERLIQEIGAR